MISRRSILAMVGLGTLLALLIVAWLDRVTQAPLYQPGRVAAMTFPAVSSPPEAPTWELEKGVEVKVLRDGQGPRVLFVHGGPARPLPGFPPGLQALAANHQLISWDQRGCGASSRPVDRVEQQDFFAAARRIEAEVGLTAQVADLERIRRLLGEEKLVLIGHGSGAVIASLYAAEFPQRIQAMVLVAPDDVLELPSPRGSLALELRARVPGEKRVELEAYLRRSGQLDALFTKSEAQLGAFNAELDGYYALVAKAAHFEVPPVDAKAVGGFAVQAMVLGLGARHDWRPLMQRVAAPVLVVHGAKDLLPESASRAFAAAFPHGKVEVLEGAGHFPFLDAPEAFSRVVGAFLFGGSAPTSPSTPG